MPYAHESPAVLITIPPSAGPINPAPFHMTWFNAEAGATSPGETTFGRIASRAGIAPTMHPTFTPTAASTATKRR